MFVDQSGDRQLADLQRASARRSRGGAPQSREGRVNVLVTGGAGYIGSHAVRVLLDAGHTVTVLDNLSHGFKQLIDPRARFLQADVAQLPSLMVRWRASGSIDAVMHFAAFIEVGESVIDPGKYYRNNAA